MGGNDRLSWWTVIITWCVILVCVAMHWPKNAFAWDSFGYHLYLPAAVQHHDLALKDPAWVDQAMHTYNSSGTLYQVTTLDDGTRVVKYSMGLAVLWTPWYLLGHAAAALTHASMDGYSAPYQSAVLIGVLFYILVGLHWLRKALLHGFSDRIAAAVILLVVFGTNYLDHAVFGLTMPHIVLFTLYAGIIRFTIRWRSLRGWADAFRLAVLMGLAALCRPTEVLAVLIPALWGLTSMQGRRAHWVAMRHQWKQWALIAGVMFLIGLPQFLYWKAIAGHWFVDSYGNPGEGFDLLAPHTVDFLFSFRKGWYLYTPLMALATLGFFALREHWPAAFLALLVFFLIDVYIVSSWTCWWYADSFSSRAMVGAYPVMALPLGALLTWAVERGRHRWAIIAVCGLCVALNLFQQWQFAHGIIHSSRMTKAAWIAGFGRTHVPEGFEGLLLVGRSYSGELQPPDGTRYRRVTLPEQLTTVPPNADLDTVMRDTLNGRTLRMLRLDKDHIYTPGVRLPFHTLTYTDHAYVDVEWTVWVPAPTIHASIVMTMDHAGHNYAYHADDLEKMALHPGWNTVRTRYLTPEVRSVNDPFVTYLWSRDTTRFFVSPPIFTIQEPVSEP